MPVELVIGAVGLAVQIIETSSKIKEIIRTYKEAVREMQRLALKVDHAESMCLHIKKLFEQEDSRDSPIASLNEAVGIPILQSISATLKELNEILIKFQRRAEGKSPLKTAGWVWMDKKDRVQRLMGELESDLNILTQTMTSNIYSHIDIIRQQLIVPPAVLQVPSEPTTMARSSPDSDVAAMALKNMMNPTGELVISKTEENVKTQQWPLAFSTKITQHKVSKKTRWNDRIETDTVQEIKSVTFSHPYLGRQLKFTYRFGSLCRPSYALTMPHIINVYAPGWEAIGRTLNQALRSDNVQLVQHMMSTGQVSPRTRLKGMWVGESADGGTLFEHAMVYSQGNLCQFLAQQDPSVIVHDEDEIAWPDTRIMFHPNRFNKRALKTVLYLLAPSYHRSDPVSLFKFLAGPHFSPNYILDCYEFCRPQALSRISDLVAEAVRMCYTAWARLRRSWDFIFEDTDAWTMLLMRLKEDGLQLHARVSENFDVKSRWRPCNFVGFLSSLRKGWELNPYVWEVTLFAWLKVIEGLGIDVREYLEVERAYCTESTRMDLVYSQDDASESSCVVSGATVRSVYGLDIPTLEARVVNEGPANDVCLEFTSFGLYQDREDGGPMFGSLSFGSLSTTILERETPHHQNWKIAGDQEHRYQWPFAAGLLGSIDVGLSSRPDDDDEFEKRSWRQHWSYTMEAEQTIINSFLYAEELRDLRFRRRQRRRLCKMGLEDWPRKGKRAMPGAWVDGY